MLERKGEDVTDAAKKVLVVLVGGAIIGAIVLFRTGQVISDTLRERADDRARREAACEATVETTVENESPLPGYRSRMAYRSTMRPATRAAVRLATLKLPGTVKDHERIINSDTLQYQCLYNAGVELGGNLVVIEGIEKDAEKAGRGKLVEGVYLVVAPALPDPYAARFPDRVSIVTEVFDESPAQRAGLRPGDVIVDLDRHGLGQGRGEDATEVDVAVNALSDDVAATMTVIRSGQVLALSVQKEHGKWGYRYQAVPILKAE